MSTSLVRRYSLTGIVALAGFSACAAAASAPPAALGATTAPRTLTAWAPLVSRLPSDASASGLLYVADPLAEAIEIYKADVNSSPIGSISMGIAGPLGLAIHGGTLYVAENTKNSIVEYAHGSKVPTATLSGTANPIGVAVGNDGTVYACSGVANTCNEYAPGATSPTLTLSIPCPFAPAVDAADNLYVAYNGCNGTTGVVRFAPGSTRGTDLGISFTGAPADIEVDREGNILVGDPRKGRINVYRPGGHMRFRTIATGYPYMFTLDRNETTLYVAGGSNFPAVVVAFDYASGQELGTITSGLTSSSGIAGKPAL